MVRNVCVAVVLIFVLSGQDSRLVDLGLLVVSEVISSLFDSHPACF